MFVQHLVMIRFGHLFTDFDFDWNSVLRTTAEFVQQCLIVGPANPLKDINGFDVAMLRLVQHNRTLFVLGVICFLSLPALTDLLST